MKKQAKKPKPDTKLKLRTETLRKLETSELSQVAGGLLPETLVGL
jgi:hypothetical protein